MPLHHPPGHAQVDFGEAVVEVGGRREKVAFFCLILPHSNVWFVKAYPRETTEAFLDGHVSAFAFLGGVPRSILYDNTTLAVARILGDGTRRRTQAFTHLQSHYLFRDRFGRPGKGNDKGKVEALVKTARRRFPPMDYADKLPPSPWYIFAPPRRYIFPPPLTLHAPKPRGAIRRCPSRPPVPSGPRAPGGPPCRAPQLRRSRPKRCRPRKAESPGAPSPPATKARLLPRGAVPSPPRWPRSACAGTI